VKKSINLFNGDCLDVMKNIPDKSIDLILTDPPYGTTACKWDTVIPFDKMWEQLNRIIKDNGAIVLFGSEPFSSHLRLSNIKNFKYDWIWHKVKPSNPLIAKKQPLPVLETISVFYKKQCNYFPQMDNSKPAIKRGTVGGSILKTTNTKMTSNQLITSIRFPTRLLTFSNANNTNRFHPTQKPVALLEYLIKTYTQEKETVLDFTMGSGSTGVACKNLNRKFIGIELDKEYFKIAEERIKNA
jgi:site-specific DNA-methyltransferase (adenine-specific)